jgi:ABC-type branched-subunit amino acid transport system substrate-binding protein
VVLLATVLAACEVSAPAAPGPGPSTGPSAGPSAAASPSVASTAHPPVAVAFVQDLAPEGANDRVLPVRRAVDLAFRAGALEGGPEVQMLAFDTQGDAATAGEVADEIAADPSIVAAIVAPDVAGQSDLVGTLGPAGIPVVSLSARGTVPSAFAGTWLRLVAPLRAQATALAETVRSLPRARDGVCAVRAPADGTVFGRTVLRELRRELEVTDVADAAAVADARCGVVLWTGGAEAGAELAAALDEAVARPITLVGGPSLRDPLFLELVEGAAGRAVSVCSCADVSTSLDLDAQRFVQDFQSEFGSPPGPFAVEGWDAGSLLIAALRDGGPSLEDVRSWLAANPAFEGLGGSYAFVRGELADPQSAIHRYRVEGGRWVEVGTTAVP